eukprot:1065999-Pleurochrysis_carterae.AAC.1
MAAKVRQYNPEANEVKEVRRSVSTDPDPARGRCVSPTGEVWLYHSEPSRLDVLPVSCKLGIPESTPDAGELAEVIQGACRRVLSTADRPVLCSVTPDE